MTLQHWRRFFVERSVATSRDLAPAVASNDAAILIRQRPRPSATVKGYSIASSF
jgi:hypothetical protein